jgi:putative ABC transport system substrate-binding protein
MGKRFFGLTLSALLFALCSVGALLSACSFPAEAQQPGKGVHRIGVLWAGSATEISTRLEAFRQGLRDLGYVEKNNIVFEYRFADGAFKAALKERANALSTATNPVITGHKERIMDFAAKNRLPAIYPRSEFVDAGGLMFYGVNFLDLWRRAATYVDKILKGTQPAELPVEQPTKFEFIINLKAAKQIGLTIPPNVLARADRVIR